jgi:D-alanyl-D-alanine carboxypeptidase
LIHNHSRYYHYFSSHEFAWQGQVIPSHNRFMLNYEGADGIKTGYINASGFNLVASAVRGGHRLIGAVFGGNTGAWRDQRMAQLFDSGYAHLGVGEGTLAEQSDDEPEAPAAQPMKTVKPAVKTAKVTKKAKQVQESEGDDDTAQWAIQVGAFSQFKPAHHAATTAARALGGLIAKASIDIDAEKARKASIYRARLIGFSAPQAQAACKKLARAKRECHVVQPES